MNKIWKEINGYKICNDGTIIGKHGKPLSTKPSKDGYVSTTIDLGKGYGVINGRHRIIATVFIDNPNNLPEVNHKDANKENNHDWNLEWRRLPHGPGVVLRYHPLHGGCLDNRYAFPRQHGSR